jgi:outer membrane biosynthesis protein TonB
MSFFLQVVLSAITIGSMLGAFSQQAGSPAPHDAAKGDAILVNLSQPIYPRLARQVNIDGEVAVAVTVHPDGTTEVALESGHAMLIQAALE